MLKQSEGQLTNLEMDQIQAYLSDRFQLHDLLEFVLTQTGPAVVIMTTFSISEEFVRKMIRMKESGLISFITIAADYRTAVKALRLTLFTNNAAEELLLGNNHSKIILIKNADWKVSIVTSQNQTRGNRLESGVIITYSTIYDILESRFLTEKEKMTNAGGIFG